jgi:asparagine synthase (glutamine-hydrolysing)
MPGLLGGTTSVFPERAAFQQAASMLVYADHQQPAARLEDTRLKALRIADGITGSDAATDDVYVWVDGEWYHDAPHTPAQQLLHAWRENRLNELLAKVDGYYTAALFLPKEAAVYLITDRFGLKPLYCWQEGHFFAWASQLKCFLACPGFPKQLDREAVNCFLETGFVAGDRSWFLNTRLIPAASCWKFDLKRHTWTRQERYWTWSAISTQSLSFDDACDGLAKYWQQAIESRAGADACVSLSGGLDSRAIAAAWPDQHTPPQTFTFGTSESWDVQIARQLARTHHWPHTHYPLTAENFWKERWKGVWKSDGFKNIFHLHFSVHQAAIARQCSLNLNGILGGVALGGIYASRFPDQRITSSSAQKLIGAYAYLDHPEQSFYELEKVDPYIINNRIRRFSAGGLNEWSCLTPQRNPFTDHALLEFLYGLPDAYRKDSRLFNTMLIRHYKAFVADIPWQRTGVPITRKWQTRWILRSRWRGIQRRMGWLRHYNYTQYDQWLRQPEQIAEFRKLLDPAHALYPQLLDIDLLSSYLEPFLAGNNRIHDRLGCALTLEYWLQCVYNDLRPCESSISSTDT